MNRFALALVCLVGGSFASSLACAKAERTFKLAEFSENPTSFNASAELDETGKFTFWFPGGADEFVLPISAGVVVDTSNAESIKWVRKGSPWFLGELPILGLCYGNQLVSVVVPSPQYAELVVEDSVGIRFSQPKNRFDAAPVEVVVSRIDSKDPLDVAKQFRKWRATATETGAVPKPRPIRQKIADLPAAERLLGAPHIYLWGPALFSSHDIPREKWPQFAQALESGRPGSFANRLLEFLPEETRSELKTLAAATSPQLNEVDTLALAMNDALTKPELLGLSPDSPAQDIIEKNRQAFASAFSGIVNPTETWADGPSLPLLSALHDAGVDRALLVLSDLYERTVRPDVAAYAKKVGYLYGPYDSYHSIHPPDAKDTWETAQFDWDGFNKGQVINADGTGHHGFLGRGFHFSPQVAWPYVGRRVGGIVEQAPYSTWFVDCDATAECFEDYSPEHPTTKLQDTKLRRERLQWLESNEKMIVGSEGGSVLFADVIHYGHGVHTPFIIHLEPMFRDRNSPYFLGAHFPPSGPDQGFKPTNVPPSVKSPYFDPTMRIPLYQAAVGDEVVNTHHWSMDSFKFKDVAQVRELMEILYMAPPMYHLNRASWPLRKDRIVRHFNFWSPLHRVLAPSPLSKFEYQSDDRLVQRTTFTTEKGDVSVTVNFGSEPNGEYPGFSATVSGPIEVKQRVYVAEN
jgi:hypothetical protein